MDEETGATEENGSEGLRDEAGAGQVENNHVDNQTLQSEIQELKSLVTSLATARQPQQAVEDSGVTFTAEEKAAIAKDPSVIADLLQRKTKEATDRIKNEATKQRYDTQAYTDYPVLKTDKKFQQAVLQQMREYVGNGEYSQDHPMLLIRATQMVAGKMNGVAMSQGKGKEHVSSAEPTRGAARTTTSASVKVPDTLLRFAKTAGAKGEELERFKQHYAKHGKRDFSKPRTLGASDE